MTNLEKYIIDFNERKRQRIRYEDEVEEYEEEEEEADCEECEDTYSEYSEDCGYLEDLKLHAIYNECDDDEINDDYQSEIYTFYTSQNTA
jgi:hypothetical protein